MDGLVPLEVYEILKDVVNGDIQNFVISVHDPNKKGEGYLGQMFFVSLKEKGNGKQLNIVVKQAFSDEKIRTIFPIRDVFLNEIYFYSKLWPKFQRFQEVIPSPNRFNNVAKCLAGVSQENFEALVMENLKYEGFSMHNKREPLDRETFEFILKVYGRFHAISFAYKELNPEEFSALTKEVIDVWVSFSQLESFKGAIKQAFKQYLLSLEPGTDDEIIEKYRHYVDDGLEFYKKSLVNGKYTCITHGDCWSNNMMFKYDESGKVIDLKLLDFQIVRLGSPVCDLSYTLYSGGTKEILDDLDYFLQVYHDSLSENLRAYGCDPNEVYPMEALKNDWKLYCQLGILMGSMVWRAKMTYADDAIDVTDFAKDGDMRKFFEANYDKEMYHKRIRDIILHAYENNYLF